MDHRESGVNSGNRNLIVGIIIFILLIWGPIDPYGLWFRIAYIIIIPVLSWYLLKYFGKFWNAGALENDRLSRVIVMIIAVSLFIGAYSSATADYHSECTQEARTREGTECIGEYIKVDGPDWSGAIILALGGTGAIWYAVKNHKKKD